MDIRIRNIGKVRNADVSLKRISVIAGTNNTGKSTIGKALYSVFNSFYKADNYVVDQQKRLS